MSVSFLFDRVVRARDVRSVSGCELAYPNEFPVRQDCGHRPWVHSELPAPDDKPKHAGRLCSSARKPHFPCATSEPCDLSFLSPFGTQPAVKLESRNQGNLTPGFTPLSSPHCDFSFSREEEKRRCPTRRFYRKPSRSSEEAHCVASYYFQLFVTISSLAFKPNQQSNWRVGTK